MLQIAAGVVRSGQMFRGVVPGLMRSTIANGCSMVVYRKVEGLLKAQLHADAEA